MVLYGVSFPLFILLNIMILSSPVCSREKTQAKLWNYITSAALCVFNTASHRSLENKGHPDKQMIIKADDFM